MNKLLMVSPHFDDAILSAGQFMAERPDVVVVTIFGGMPESPERIVTPYDTKCGFKNAQDAVSERRRENDAAVAMLHATKIDLDFPDGQYEVATSEVEITDVLQRIVDGQEFDAIYAPLGLGHPDHMKVSNAVLKLDTKLPVVLWEDLPIRITEPELVPDRLQQLGLAYRPSRTILDRKFIADKIRALMCYSSQMGTGILDPYLMFVPERFYDFKKS